MSILDDIRDKRGEIRRIVARHHAADVRLIGSVARDEAGPDSDVDLVVRFLAAATPRSRATMTVELEALLGRTVEVISETDLWDSTRRDLRRECVPL